MSGKVRDYLTDAVVDRGYRKGPIIHVGIEYDGTWGPIGTCDDPFCACHREHAAESARVYRDAVDGPTRREE
jgi:hypothetical protein